MSLKPESPLEIFAFRHGQTDWNKEGRIQGHLDVPLNAQGHEEAARLGLALRRIPFGVILSSDLSRAVRTSEILLARAEAERWHPIVPILRDERLREVHLGALQGLTHAEIHEKFGAELSGKLGRKILSDEELRDLGSESIDALLARVMGAIHETSLRAEFKSDPTLALGLSTHGGVLRRLLHWAGGIEQIRFPIPNAVLFRFHYSRQNRTLRFVPETTYLTINSTDR